MSRAISQLFAQFSGEILAMNDVQAAGSQKITVVIHSPEFDHHALLDGRDELLSV